MKTARVFRALTLALSVWAGAGVATEAYGNNHRARETVYVSPVETAWVVPTAYVYPTSYYYATSYVWPTSYVVPTVYSAAYTVAPTSYVVPTSYYTATSYYTPTSLSYYWPTAWWEPTVAYLPTVVDYPLVTASVACESAPARVVRAAPSQPARTRSEPQRSQPPAAVESEPAAPAPPADEPVSSRVDQKPNESKPSPAPVEPEPKKNPARLPSFDGAAGEEKDFTPLSPNPADKEPVSPPAPGAVEREPVKKTAEEPPVVPNPPANTATPDQLPLDLPVPGETVLRKARKPVLGTPSNVLNGVVNSGQTGERVEGVPITLSNRLEGFSDRKVETDAYGRFAVRLPDGEWDVLVTMPSGRVYSVSRLTVSSGKIVDDQGRKIPSLIITR